MAKKKIRFKKSFYVLIISIIIFIIAFTIIKRRNDYLNSDFHKLEEIGYSETEINKILNSKDITNEALNREYNSYLIDIMSSKYYLSKHLDKYLEYKAKYLDTSITDVITTINTGTDKDWYASDIETDVSKNELMLVNKFHYLNENYEIENLVDMAVKYATANKKLNATAYEYFTKMCDAAKRSGYVIYATTTFRTYKSQENAYINLKNEGGKAYADKYAARPGFSEHETGLAVDIAYINEEEDKDLSFELSEEYNWLINNASEYGFILRYPKDKENITGFNYEPWHFRYVGIEAAKTIEKEGITFDEYYAFYVE